MYVDVNLEFDNFRNSNLLFFDGSKLEFFGVSLQYVKEGEWVNEKQTFS